MRNWIRGTMLVGALLLMGLALPATAQEEDECTSACRQEARDCRFDVREAGRDCFEENGCDVLREEYRETCHVEDRDVEACRDARTAYRECTTPCREVHRESARTCREDLTACYEDCGVELPTRRPRRPRGRRR